MSVRKKLGLMTFGVFVFVLTIVLGLFLDGRLTHAAQQQYSNQPFLTLNLGPLSTGQVLQYNATDGAWENVQLQIITGTTFTIASGCATVSALKGGPTGGSFATTATTCTPVINLPVAPNGWNCQGQDITHPVAFTETAYTTSSCTITATTTSGDTIVFEAVGF